MARREFPARIKVEAFKRSGGFCEVCGALLKAGRVEYDHRIPDALGGEPTLENCVASCEPCHSEKTAREDVPNIARAKRREASDMGIRKRSRWPTAKTGKFKQRMDGTIVPRNS